MCLAAPSAFQGKPKRPSGLARFICWVSLFQPFISLQVAVEAIFVSCTYLFEVHSCGAHIPEGELEAALIDAPL